jgi:hypothetical protein
VLCVVIASLTLACASARPAPVFSKESPADPGAPAAPVAVVESLGTASAGAGGASKPAPGASASPAAPETAAYVCPMHPQARSDQPGSCPICGMRLVKAKPKGGSQP